MALTVAETRRMPLRTGVMSTAYLPTYTISAFGQRFEAAASDSLVRGHGVTRIARGRRLDWTSSTFDVVLNRLTWMVLNVGEVKTAQP